MLALLLLLLQCFLPRCATIDWDVFSSLSCNIEKVDLEVYLGGFSDFLIPSRPLIFVMNSSTYSSRNELLSRLVQRESLTRNFSNEEVILSSSNSYSHAQKRMSLGSYLSGLSSARLDHRDANEDFYLFGNNYQAFWRRIEELYSLPPCRHCRRAGALALGIGGRGSGVAFHMHGPGFSETVHGSKHWFLYPPDTYPTHFSPNMTVLQWTLQFYREEKRNPSLLECSIAPNELLYFPDKWVHATLNLDDYNFFVSLFLDVQLMS